MDEKRTDYLNKIKVLWEEKGRKKDNFVILILLGILLIVIVWPLPDTGGQSASPPEEKTESVLLDSNYDMMSSDNDQTFTQGDDLKGYTAYMENRLEQVLAAMEGAGEVKVMITLKSSEEIIVEKDIPISRASVSEVDAQGGSRFSNDIDTGEETVHYKDANGNEVPYIRQILQPEIEGVLVVTQGGDRITIQENISEAIKALFGIDEHKIKVVKMITE